MMGPRRGRSILTSGATCLVTGGNRGIGLAIIEELVRRPVHVLVGVRDLSRYRDIVPPPDGAVEVRPVCMDLSSAHSIERSCTALGDDISKIDVLINNAGLFTAGLLEGQSAEEMYAMVQVNLLGLMHLTMRVLPGMLPRGSGLIVNNASIAAYAHLPTATTYTATKAGVAAFTSALHRELRGTGIRTLTLITPAVSTDMLESVDHSSGRHVDTSRWRRLSPQDWAERVVRAIDRGDRVVEGTAQPRVLRAATHAPLRMMDAVAGRMFSRQPQG